MSKSDEREQFAVFYLIDGAGYKFVQSLLIGHSKSQNWKQLFFSKSHKPCMLNKM